MPSSPELSIIVPLLNECETLPRLFATLSVQEKIVFELIAVDGGSDDTSVEVFSICREASPFPAHLIQSERGRALQLNAGLQKARGEYLLFLHADSQFDKSDALFKGLEALRSFSRRGNDLVAGRFALRFDLPHDRRHFGYYFYESKARLDRPGCIHGDQGFLVSRCFLEIVGSFDNTLPVLEDDRFADAVRRYGEWILLPTEILTSVRRFESEGLKERQTLNALLMNFASIGWDAFFRNCDELYCRQDRTGRLDLYPWFLYINRLLQKTPVSTRFALWYRTGQYVRSNAWQIKFFFKMRRRFASSLPPADSRFMRGGRSFFELMTDNFAGNLLTALFVYLWFHFMRTRLKIQDV